jgi:hypothetical protein
MLCGAVFLLLAGVLVASLLIGFRGLGEASALGGCFEEPRLTSQVFQPDLEGPDQPATADANTARAFNSDRGGAATAATRVRP